MNKILSIVEGLLFLSGDEGLAFSQIKKCLQQEYDDGEIQECLDCLMNRYQNDEHGMELVCFGGNYKFISKASIHPYAQVLFASTKVASLSNAALETLAIIAYKQPITRVEIEELRGVGCDMMIRKLISRGLIQECGRSDAPGKPFLYGVTNEFMDTFQLESLNELPDLPKFENAKEELFE